MRRILVLGVVLLSALVAAQVDPNLYSGLTWRNIGPFRAGRVAAVSGVIGQPGVFYMGLPLGGVWKTTSAGVTWFPIFDSVKDASCVGAIEVAPSDPNVIYVGMGDLITGGGINEGNGVYKSSDAGKTWQHMGLDETKQIPSILVDPHDPNLVLVAAQGNVHKQSDVRGVYRSIDGGKTWAKTLFVDNETGIQKIAWAYDNPKVMLATTVRHYNAPGAGRGGFGGGASGTHLFKSTDEGLTWTEIKSETLPPLAGRTCVAVACGTNSQRMFLVQNSGLWRSDDGGGTWQQMDKEDGRVRNGQGGYNCGVYSSPSDHDTVYVFNTCSYVSHDGGKTFTGWKGAPGGDDPQQLWIDPTRSDRILMGMDQGATVSFDGGKTWSQWYNQATGQFYHIACDNRWPYWVYGTEQDSGSIGTSTRGNYGEVTPMDWSPHPGYEFGSIVADPLNPNITYAGSEGSGIVKVTNPSGQWVNVSPNIDASLRLRKVGNQPLLWNPTNPHELLTGFQFLMATTDGGMHWKKLGVDLTLAKGQKEPAEPPRGTRRSGGNVDFDDDNPAVINDGSHPWKDEDELENDRQGGFGGGAIESISVSSVNGGIIWVGTSNGLVKLTQDHGKTWEDVTIAGLPARADISAIDASHHEAGEAYAAVDCHNTADFTPYFYRTTDFGKTWTKIISGLPTDQPSGSFARVIRADTKAKGLIFCGTESSVYASFDDGNHWQSVANNFPNTSVRDMVVKDNDLVVGTYGRAFWVLDDISALRQLTPGSKVATRLFAPGRAIRVRRNVGQDTPFPPEVPHALNPPICAIDYALASTPRGRITLEIKDAKGNVVRHMSSDPIPPLDEPAPPIPDFWVESPKPMPTDPGMHRIDWNLRYDDPPAFSHSYEINANPGQTPASPEGPLVMPGTYTVVLTVDGQSYSQLLVVRNDPRSPSSMRDLQAQHDVVMKLYDCAKQAWDSYQQATAMKNELAELAKGNPPTEVADAVKAFDTKVTAICGGGGGRRFGGGFRGGSATPTFAGLVSQLVRNIDALDSADMAPSESLSKTCSAACDDLKKAMLSWQALTSKDLVALNTLLEKHNLKAIATSPANR